MNESAHRGILKLQFSVGLVSEADANFTAVFTYSLISTLLGRWTCGCGQT